MRSKKLTVTADLFIGALLIAAGIGTRIELEPLPPLPKTNCVHDIQPD